MYYTRLGKEAGKAGVVPSEGARLLVVVVEYSSLTYYWCSSSSAVSLEASFVRLANKTTQALNIDNIKYCFRK